MDLRHLPAGASAKGSSLALWQHSAIAFRLRRFLSACATACFHLGGLANRWTGWGQERNSRSGISSRLRGDRDSLPSVASACRAAGAGTWCPACPAGLSDRSTNATDGSRAGILANILGPGKVRRLGQVEWLPNVTGTADFPPLLL